MFFFQIFFTKCSSGHVECSFDNIRLFNWAQRNIHYTLEGWFKPKQLEFFKSSWFVFLAILVLMEGKTSKVFSKTFLLEHLVQRSVYVRKTKGFNLAGCWNSCFYKTSSSDFLVRVTVGSRWKKTTFQKKNEHFHFRFQILTGRQSQKCYQLDVGYQTHIYPKLPAWLFASGVQSTALNFGDTVEKNIDRFRYFRHKSLSAKASKSALHCDISLLKVMFLKSYYHEFFRQDLDQ